MSLIAEIVTLAGVAKGVLVVALILFSEGALLILRTRARSAYEAAKKEAIGFSGIEAASLMYYRRRQMLGITRFSTYVLAALFAALLYDFQTFGVLALALSALVIIQKENINSLFAYVFVLSNFNVGDDIRVGEMLGEVVRVTPLQTILSGKDENGESNGQRVVIPNYKLVTEIVTEQELKSNTYRRIVIRAVYEHGAFETDFGEFVKRIRAFLDEFLPKWNLGITDTKRREPIPIEEYLRDWKNYGRNAAGRLLKAYGDPHVVDTAKDEWLGRIFSNRTIKLYPAFKDFFGMEETIMASAQHLQSAADGLIAGRQIQLYYGPPGSGKSSFAT